MDYPKSKYEIIKSEILNRIEKGDYETNEKLPSESELCKMYDTSRITVRKALDELEVAGILYRLQGVGSFVGANVATKLHQNTNTILLVFPNYPEIFGFGIISDILKGVEEALSKTDYSFVTMFEAGTYEDADRFCKDVRKLNPKGIVYCFYYNKIQQDQLRQLNIPIVFLDSQPHDIMFDLVTGEDFDSAYRVTNLLLLSGCSKIGFYSQWSLDYSTCRLRYNGVRQALRDSNRLYQDKWFRTQENVRSHEDVMHIDLIKDVRNYLTENQGLDAIVAMNDSTSMAILNVAQEMDLSIPEDLKLVSFGNYNGSAYFQGGITSFEQYFSSYGKEAVQLLLKRIQNRLSSMQQKRVIRYNLVRRKSF